MKMINHEVNGLQISQRRDDGYINATALSKAHYKATKLRRDTNHWLALERTKKSIEHLSRLTEISVDQLVIKVRTGRNEYRGTYIHPRLAVRFGIWLSDDFGYMVEEWVSQWMTTGNNPISPKSTGIPADLLSGLEELEQLIISIRSQARAVHTCAHQPIDELLAKSLHALSHNQLSAIASAVHQMQTLKELGTMTAELPLIPEIGTIEAQSTPTVTQKKQLVSVNIKLPLSQKRWLADIAQTIRQNNLQPLPAGERVYPQHLIQVAVELLQHSDVNLDSAYSIFLDLDESLANTNFKMVREQQEWLADLAQIIRNNCSVPTLPNERVYPQHLIGVAIDLLKTADVDWGKVRNVEGLREQLKI